MIKRTLYFDVIQDTRFSVIAEDNVGKWASLILDKLAGLPVKCQTDVMRSIPFSGDEPCTSYRQRIYVRKAGRISWEKVYEAINSVKVCCFHFLACHRIK